jgi:hypothetical protein
VFYGETSTISNCHCVIILERLLNRQVFKFVGDVGVGTTVYKLLIIKSCICLGYHSNQLRWRVSTLVRVVHAVKTIKSLMTGFPTNLTWDSVWVIEVMGILIVPEVGRLGVYCRLCWSREVVPWIGCSIVGGRRSDVELAWRESLWRLILLVEGSVSLSLFLREQGKCGCKCGCIRGSNLLLLQHHLIIE